MRNRGALLGSVMLIVLASMLVGAGTFAYFSETEVVTTTFAAGTVDVQLSIDRGVSWHNGLTVSTPSGWAPGDDFSLEIWLRNMGTSGSKVLWVGGSNPSGWSELANKIEITTFDATEWPTGGYMGIPISYWQGVFDGGAPLTLKEFVDSPYHAVFWEGTVTVIGGKLQITDDYLEAGGAPVQAVKLVFHFMDDADNWYQGKTYTFDLEITGTDDPSILGKGGGCYGYI